MSTRKSRHARPLGALLAALWLASAAPAEEVLVDGIAAQVGTDIVLLSEVMQIVAAEERRMRAAGATEPEVAKLRAEGLETMIEWRLIEKVVRDTELYATDAEVDATIDAIARENGISSKQLEKSVTTHNMTFEGYKAEIKRELERRKVVNSLVAAGVHVEEEDVKALYQERFASQPEGGSQVRLRQMMISAAPEQGLTVDAACQAAEQMRERIAAGGDFDGLARKFSSAMAANGGDVGWLHTNSMAPWMRRLVEPLAEGELSPVERLPVGCTFVRLEGRQEWKPVTFEEIQPRLRGELFETQLASEYRKWMERLRERTYIERRGYFADASNFRAGSIADAYRPPASDELPSLDSEGSVTR